MEVKDLKPRAAVDEITLEIVSKGEVRDFANDKGQGKVCNCAAKDASGEISMTLWNEQCAEVEEGDTVKIENGWVSEFRGEKQVSTGRNGTLTKVEE